MEVGVHLIVVNQFESLPHPVYFSRCVLGQETSPTLPSGDGQ